jgi:hypothetical protein
MTTAMVGDTVITQRDHDFRTQLERGDVLLFDRLEWVSHLAKLVENRPFNHCGVYTGEGSFIHCGRPTAQYDALRVEPLSGWLSVHTTTVTVLRHRADQRADVAFAAQQYLYDQVRFDYGALLRMAIPAAMRSYTGWVGRGSVSRGLDRVSDGLLRPASRGADRFTCASFIYVAFRDAGLRLDPPGRLHPPRDWTVTIKDIARCDDFDVPVILHRPLGRVRA